MISWLIKSAPIRLKLRISFGLFNTIIAAMAALLAYQQMQSGGAMSHTPLYFGIGLLAGSMLLGLLLTAGIADPYVNTVVRMEALAAGNLDSPVRYTEYKDCVGRLTRAMRTFRDAAVERNQLQAESGLHQQELDRRLSEAQSAFTASGRDQTHLVSALARALEALAAGDLTARLPHDIAAEYRKLGEDFNGALEALEQMVRTIMANARGIHTGAGEISGAADNLSRRTEQQAAALEQTAAALDQITATVKKAAEGSELAEKVVSQTIRDAAKSGQVVAEAVTAMNGIEESSRQIGQIIGVIDEIAFQTNLLALNAGVEAARAGDAGRGFAVVASEVRALAQRSASAAKEIKTLIGASTQQVESGVRLVRETGQALDRIVEQVAQINGLIVEISSSAREQASGLSQVNTAVNGMDQVTQQNAAMVEESTAASHALAQEADELSRLVRQFSVGGGADHKVTPLKRPAAKPPAQAPRVAQGSRGGAALARRPAPAAHNETWEEF